jgi:hypothetical protein
MADTGSPWFIPFAEPSDLVRDWPALSSAVGTAVAAGLTSSVDSRVVKQVAVGTDATNRTTTSASFVDGDISVSITPTSASSKILLIWSVAFKVERTSANTFLFGGVAITDSADVVLANAEQGVQFISSSASNRMEVPAVLITRQDAVDTAARTYKGRFRASSTGTSATLSNSGATGLLMAIEYTEA